MAPPANDPIMGGRSIWSFRHPERQNLSIIDAIGYYNRIRKNVTENRKNRTENPIMEATLIPDGSSE